jgi:hypothetical protein
MDDTVLVLAVCWLTAEDALLFRKLRLAILLTAAKKTTK